MPAVTRRDFLKVGMTGAGALAVAGLGFDVALADSTKVKQTLRIAGAKEMHSICPYCAVGCSLVAYTRQNSDGSTQLLQIEGDPDSPVNEGRLCPKGATAMQLAVSPRRQPAVSRRRRDGMENRVVGFRHGKDRPEHQGVA